MVGALGAVLGDQSGDGRRIDEVGEHRAERADHKAILFCLLELSQWHRTFVEGALPAPAGTPLP